MLCIHINLTYKDYSYKKALCFYTGRRVKLLVAIGNVYGLQIFLLALKCYIIFFLKCFPNLGGVFFVVNMYIKTKFTWFNFKKIHLKPAEAFSYCQLNMAF